MVYTTVILGDKRSLAGLLVANTQNPGQAQGLPTHQGCLHGNRLLAFWGLSAAARGVGAGAAVGLDVSASSLVLSVSSVTYLMRR